MHRKSLEAADKLKDGQTSEDDSCQQSDQSTSNSPPPPHTMDCESEQNKTKLNTLQSKETLKERCNMNSLSDFTSSHCGPVYEQLSKLGKRKNKTTEFCNGDQQSVIKPSHQIKIRHHQDDQVNLNFFGLYSKSQTTSLRSNSVTLDSGSSGLCSSMLPTSSHFHAAQYVAVTEASKNFVKI